MVLKLEVVKRDAKTNNNTLRAGGNIPAVFYGKKQESTPVSINTRDFYKVWKEAGESTVVILKEGENEHETLIHDVAVDAVSEEPIHADFYAFEKGKTLEVDVPLEFVGVSPAVKDLGGTLVKVVYELSIEAIPSKLPQQIEVDISSLVDFESQIQAKDLKLPEGVELAIEPEEVIALVSEANEEEPEETVEADLSSIEVEGEKKPEEGESEDSGGDDKDNKKDKKEE